ncbi:sirohydrochlorin chelatase [Caldalkalibacillus mannanilyticus]|uniref:sirohydrochlorin chelatase n=1 Tax=Caldalkalibacillus mannanilyticus TaxID=1418 RepID=UPI000469DA85|nr:CbiX/SirB N-terminal domain-containing protein [Caldalkalibacillus mannanilyticus]
MSRTGILILAHGSRNAKWIQYIEEVVHSVQTEHPVQIGYLELVEGKSIADGVRKLNELRVSQIKAIPLFMCSGSTHLEEIQYALGIIKESRIPTDLEPIDSAAEIIWMPPLDDHLFVLQILDERVQALVNQAEQEHLLIIAHGSEIEGFQDVWEKLLENICRHIQEKYSFVSTTYATLHPDTIREKAERISRIGELVILPLFLSEGYFTTQLIPNKLEGIQYRYKGQTLLPHPLVKEWIAEGINQ